MLMRADILQPKTIVVVRVVMGLMAFLILWPTGFFLWFFLGEASSGPLKATLYIWFVSGMVATVAEIVLAFLKRINGLIVFSIAGTIMLLWHYFDYLLVAEGLVAKCYMVGFIWLFLLYIIELTFIVIQGCEERSKKRP